MLRLIIRRKFHDAYSGAKTETLHTIDVDCPELEQELKAGGWGESGYDIRELAGVEVLTLSAIKYWRHK